MDLDISHLRMVCAMAETGSVTRAAARMGMSQPAMSNQLRRVEEIVGGALFTRSRSGLEPTPLGGQVISRARTILSEMDTLFGDLRGPRSPQETLGLGCVHLACVGSIVARVGEALPGREVSLRIEPSSALLGDALARGHLDAALIGLMEGFDIPLAAPVVSRTLVPRYPIFVTLSENHPLAGRDEIDLFDLRDEAPSGAACPLVAAGHGVRMVDPSWPPHPGTVVRPLAGEPQVARLIVAWRRDRLGEEEAAALYRGLAAAYLEHTGSHPTFEAWWHAHPQVHPLL
jgi:DNA-binding transcriptional LysR family regulator